MVDSVETFIFSEQPNTDSVETVVFLNITTYHNSPCILRGGEDNTVMVHKMLEWASTTTDTIRLAW
jgi:hypothetical protein